MLTRSGWATVVAAAVIIVAGRLLGAIEFYVVGAMMALLVVAAVIYVRMSRFRLNLGRQLTPIRVHAGEVARVELHAVNNGRRRSPLLTLHDPVGGTKGARLLLAPLRVGESAVAAYRLPTSRRGRVDVGPLTVTVTDPFHVARVQAVGAPRAQLVVLPRIDPIAPPAGAGGRDPRAALDQASALGRTGTEFHSLRPYVVGDDLRRVHWASSARSEDLMIRIDEVDSEGRCAILMDLRRDLHTADSFEDAISAATSVMHAAWNRRTKVRILATDGTDITATGPTEQLLDYLSTVEPHSNGALSTPVLVVQRGRSVGSLVAITGAVGSEDLNRLAALARPYRRVVVVRCAADPVASAAGRINLVEVSAQRRFVEAWGEANEHPTRASLLGSS
jgi:uncharacterized protein (DUF58 family)